MKKAIRIITFSQYDAHTEPLFASLDILNLHQSIDYNIGKLMWEIVNTNNTPFINKLFKIDITTNSRTIITTAKYTPLTRTKYKEQSIIIKGPQLWRKLPPRLKNIKSKHMFSSAYIKHLKNAL